MRAMVGGGLVRPRQVCLPLPLSAARLVVKLFTSKLGEPRLQCAAASNE